eukprot:TRINITY_DN104174_c0_g1_i1.p1 TRINITY_DN104174_c0_g1~~TRINITY_DN104174_c0_g1_i1.p1  ORF type:complete len:529 (-),score=101.72 TRINITY_DN104174_c0_g1_i1:23-1561(-)
MAATSQMGSRPLSQMRMSRSSPCLRRPRASSRDWQAESSCLSSQEELETPLRTPEPVHRFEFDRGLVATSESSQKTARQNDRRDSACSSDASTCREQTSEAFLRQNLLQQRRLQKQRSQQRRPEPAAWLSASVRSARPSTQVAAGGNHLGTRRWSISQPQDVCSKPSVSLQVGRGLPKERREMRQFQTPCGGMTHQSRSATAVSRQSQGCQRMAASNMDGSGSMSPSSRLDVLVHKSDELLSLGQSAVACGKVLQDISLKRGRVLESELQHWPSREEISHDSERVQTSARSDANKTLRDLFCLSSAVSQRSGEISSQLATMLMCDSLAAAPATDHSSATEMQELSLENMELRETLIQAQELMTALKQQCKDDQLHLEVMEKRQQDMLLRLSAECASPQTALAAGCGRQDSCVTSSVESIACQLADEAASGTLPPLLAALEQEEVRPADMKAETRDVEDASQNDLPAVAEHIDPESAHLRAVASGASAVRELLEATERSLIKTFDFHHSDSED